MVKLYFIRHGKTEWNLESRYQGAGGDSELLPSSYQEIEQLGEFLQNIKFEHIYASPIKRAKVTAEKLVSYLSSEPPITYIQDLEEFHLGKMEGMRFTDVKKQFPDEFDNFRNHPDLYDNSEIGGENFNDVVQRMTPAIKDIVKNSTPDANVIIVSHGAALNAEINSLLGVPLSDLRKRGGLSNTSTTILETLDGGKTFKLSLWNDVSYLKRTKDETDTI